MKAKRVICIVKGHEWVAGRLAESWAREVITSKSSYHNRACTRCKKEEWNADKTETEADLVIQLKQRLGLTKTQADIESVDPKDLPPGQ